MILQIGVKAVIKNDAGKYLFLRRSSLLSTDDSDTSWDIPGGRINADEHLMDALAREIKEESGHSITSDPKLLTVQDIFVPKKDLHVVRLTYLIHENIETITLSDEHDEFKWVEYDDLESIRTEPYLESVLKSI